MEVKALCLEVGDCWRLLNIIVEITKKGSFHFPSFTLVCFVSIVSFCIVCCCLSCPSSNENC